MKLGGFLFGASMLLATPASAEHINAYWRLESDHQSGPATLDFNAPFLVQHIFPVKLARLTEAVTPSGTSKPLPAGTLVYLVVNDAGKRGWCTLKDLGGAAKSLFIPALDKRPCFVDADGDGRFESSFSVFDIYSQLSPPQPRGSIDAAVMMVQPARYESVDVHAYPEPMTLSYRLTGNRSRIEKIRLQVTLDRPGHSESVELGGGGPPGQRILAALGTIVVPQSIEAGKVQATLTIPSPAYISGFTNGTVFTATLPEAAR